jgi:RND family efflux transporter MFP subunit
LVTAHEGRVSRQLGTLLTVGTAGELTDGQLLEQFASREADAAEQAFAVLVERHGPMVLRVCHSVLFDPNDVEDAFQATFLVLVKKARGLWVSESLGPWLHQVALRTASCARLAAARRQRHERNAAANAPAAYAQTHDDLRHVLHEEIDRLPDRFRVSVVLCDLEGRTYEQAARHLGWPIGTLKSRLTRARERLRQRLTRRGLAPGAAVFANARTLIPEVRLPDALVRTTASAAVRFAASRPVLGGPAAILAQGVLTAMSMTRWWKAAIVLLVAGATVSDAGLLAGKRSLAVEPRPQQAKSPLSAGPDIAVAEVKSGTFKLQEVARGAVETTVRDPVLCKVEGRTTIIKIAPEGKKVTKGEVIVELDSAALRDQLLHQKFASQRTEAAYRNALLIREVAETALKEYFEGIYPAEKEAIQGEIRLAEIALPRVHRRQDRLERAHQRLRSVLDQKEGTSTASEILSELELLDRLDDGEEAKIRAGQSLERARAKLNVLENYTKDKTVRALSSEVNKARFEELARKEAWQLDRSKETQLAKQIENCVMVAPRNGVVIYANDSRRRPSEQQIEEGAAVRERQLICHVIDLDGPMQINAKVGEPLVDRLVNGQKARIKIDAFPGKEFAGLVTSIAPLPDATSFVSRDQKVYTTMVRVVDNASMLRPGMNATVELPITEHENVVLIPTQSVLLYDDKCHVAMRKPDGTFEFREVTVADGNGDVVEVKAGVKPGDQVALQPSELMSDAEKRAKHIGEPTRPAARKRQQQ